MYMSLYMHSDAAHRHKYAPILEPELISEATLLRRVLVRASQLGARLFRNQVGRYRLARPECRECQSRGRVIASGLCVGSSDLIGWRSITVTPEMVGQQIAVFVAAELKGTEGKLSVEQQQFLSVVNAAGGRGLIVRSVDDLL